MRLIIAITFLIAAGVLPSLARAQDSAVSDLAGLSTALAANFEPTQHVGDAAEPKHEAHHPTKTVAKTKPQKPKAALAKGGGVPRFAFDPLSLTLAPSTRIDPIATPYSPSSGAFVSADRGQVAGMPADPNAAITSAGIGNMERGNNHTVVVPLFQLLDKLSNQPPPRDQ